MSQDIKKQELLQDALGLIDDDLLQEVDRVRRTPPKKTKPNWLRLGAIAACLCVLVGAAVAGGLMGGRSQANETAGANECAVITEATAEGGLEETAEEAADETMEKAEDEEATAEGATDAIAPASGETRVGGVTIAPLTVDLCDHPDADMDMEALFIYEGRCYVQYGTLADASHLIGEKLGTATGLIDEWTEEDGYVELAGSVFGDFYSVNGFDSDFVLCMPCENDTVEIYINNNDLTLYTGADILVDRFQIDGNFTAKTMSRERWYNSDGVPAELDEEATEQVWALVEALFEAPFVYVEDVQLPEGAKNIYDTELYHLYLQLDNGMMVHLRLFDGGYVQIDGLRPVCLQVDEGVFWMTVKYLDQTESSLCGVSLTEDE